MDIQLYHDKNRTKSDTWKTVKTAVTMKLYGARLKCAKIRPDSKLNILAKIKVPSTPNTWAYAAESVVLCDYSCDLIFSFSGDGRRF